MRSIVSYVCCSGAGIIVRKRKRRIVIGSCSAGYERGFALHDRDCTSILCWDVLIDFLTFSRLNCVAGFRYRICVFVSLYATDPSLPFVF